MKKRLLTILTLLPAIAFAQTIGVPGKEVMIASPSTASKNVLLYLPWNYNSTNQYYPLILFGHGSGEADTTSVRTQGLPAVIEAGAPPYSVNASGDTTWFIVATPITTTSESMTFTSMVAGDLIHRGLRIDQSRIYITGLSAGANATGVPYINFQDKNGYQRAAATVPMSYTSNTTDSGTVGNFARMAGHGMWMFVGDSDNLHGNNQPAMAQQVVDSVNKYSPGNGRLTVFPGGHCCWTTYYNPGYRENIGGKNMNIYDWMMQYQTDTTLPPSVSYYIYIGPRTDTTTIGAYTFSQAYAIVGTTTYTNTITPYPPTFKIISVPSGENGVYISRGYYDLRGSELINMHKYGNYVVSVTITGPSGSPISDTMTVQYIQPGTTPPTNTPPVANAGNNQTITLPTNSVTLSGSATQGTGTITSIAWTKVSGGTATITSPNSYSTSVTGLTAGTYIFKLTVTDSNNLSDQKDVTITVNEGTPSATIKIVLYITKDGKVVMIQQ